MPLESPTDAFLLPPSMAQLAAVIGWPAALALVAAFPGRTLEISARPSDTMQAIHEVISAPAMSRLVAAYGCSPLYIPACKALATAERNRRMRDEVRELERNVSTRRAVTHTARKWHVVERTVWRALSPATVATTMPPAMTLYQLPLL